MHNYMPHGHCYLWEPGLIALHVGSDLLIGLAYLSISISLYLLIRKIQMPFSPIVICFGVFIAACGMTHFMEVYNLWVPAYWLSGGVKALTAAASVFTSVILIHLMPKILEFARAAKKSAERGLQLEVDFSDLELRVRERTQELELSNLRERQASERMQELYATAQKANRLKDEFLATMSHELRTPLSVILGFSEMLANGEISPEDQQTTLDTIRRNAQTQFQLVNDLLDVSRIISGKMQLLPTQVDLFKPVRDAMESVSLAAKTKSISISMITAESQILVFADAMRLQQIVWNLLSNAIKFTDPGGQVVIRLEVDQMRGKIVVEDTGQGIAPDFLPHVFERFRQEDSSSSRKVGGLGLGLGIVRHLTELHGGTIGASSEGKGKGSTFSVSLPLVDHALSILIKNLPHLDLDSPTTDPLL